MTIEWTFFLSELMQNPILMVVTLLNIGVIVVNGATDAPNAIASAVSTRCLSPTTALILAAVFNFMGLVGMTYISTAVAHTIFSMVNFGGDSHQALTALMAAMVAIIVWGAAAWWFGIPTSQSHSLIAGLTGAAIAVQGSFDAINGAEWMKVVYGILLSTLLGFGLGWINYKIIGRLFRHVDRPKANRFFKWAQICSGASVAFMHGAQDGQKFMSIGLLGIALAFGMETSGETNFPLWLMILCSAAISLGTLAGGKRIIKSVAMDMVSLEKYQGVAASVSTVITLFVASMTGMPVSTSHCSTASIMGVGASRSFRRVNWGVARRMVWAWVLTFPCCGFIGWALAKLFMLF